MIRFVTGNLLDAPTEAVINTVNTVGVMGKGIALMFKESFPENFLAYEEACKSKQVQTGRMFVTQSVTLEGSRWIINFPTKQHWRQPSRLEWIIAGLKDLKLVIEQKRIRSIAIPPLGCGNGGLNWEDVRPEIESALSELTEVDIQIFEPTSKYQNNAKRNGVMKLTPARALVAEIIRRYWVLDIECTNLEVQKLCYFLERIICQMGISDPLNLQFVANKYGPYSDRLRHLLDGLDGSYLHCDKRLSDAGPSDTIWFDQEKRALLDLYLRNEDEQLLVILARTESCIEGFQSPLGMELLATVDWLIEREKCGRSVSHILEGLNHWPAGKAAATRKKRLFDARLVGLALSTLAENYPA